MIILLVDILTRTVRGMMLKVLNETVAKSQILTRELNSLFQMMVYIIMPHRGFTGPQVALGYEMSHSTCRRARAPQD